MSYSLKIKLSQICDPCEIYIKFLEGEKSRNNDKVRRRIYNIQDDIAELAKTSERVCRPNFGQIYGCYIKTWKKWIRGKVMHKYKNDFKIFLVDHGHYMTKVSEFIEIPEEIKSTVMNGAFYKTSLGLKPAKGNKWCDDAIKVCKEISEKKNELDIRFVPLYEDQNILIGDLFVLDGKDRYSVNEKLISLNLAEKPNTDFKSIFDTLHDKNIGPLKCVQPKKRLEISECCQNTLDIPKGITLHGENLKSACTLETLDIHTSLKKNFSMKNEKLSGVQSLMWPQLCDKKHLVIISNQNDCLTSTYLLPLINGINKYQNYRKKCELLGSDAIIFAKNSTRVEEIAKKCVEYSKDLRIIKAIGMCKEKKLELLNGCDILITTIAAFSRLIEDISVEIFDENRLKFIVFDDFDQYTIQKFSKNIEVIMKTRYNVSKIPQTIIATKNVIGSIKKRILCRLPKSETVLFMDNYLDAAAFAGLSISIEIASNIDDKIQKLLKIGFEKHEKSVIVVNDMQTALKLEDEISKIGLKALACDKAEIAKLWDSSTNKCILIVTENVLNNSNIQKADNLIHFDLPSNICSDDKFSNRFKIFSNAVEKVLKSSDEVSTLKTRIIFCDENVDQFEELLNLLVARNVLNPDENVVEKINEKNEAIKCLKNVPFCQNILQYGKCKKLLCSNRHVITEQEKPANCLKQLKSFIRFDIVAVQSPTTFTIRIRDFYDNSKWISNNQIKKMLDKDMQNYCKRKCNKLSSNEGIVGEMYAKYDSKIGQWVRGKMIQRLSNGIIVLNLVDYTSLSQDIPALEESLIKLSDEFTTLNPLISKLQILNFVPLDGAISYSSNDNDKILELMNNFPKDAVCTAKVEAIIGDVVFVKNIETRNAKNSVVFGLKSVHSKLGISEIDESFGTEIMKLAEKFKCTNQDSAPQKYNKIEAHQENSKKINYWKQLTFNRNYSVTVKDYTSPYSFFVVVENPENLTLKNALKNIEESQNHQLLINPKGNDCCLIDFKNRKLRAKILSVDENVEVLLVDYGKVLSCCKENIYQIPEDFLNLQFQAVHCSMLGVRPKYNMIFWPSLQKSEIRRLLMEEPLKMNVVKKDQKKNKFNTTGICCYEVLLYNNDLDNETKIYLHEVAVEKGMASGCDEIYETTIDSDDHDSVIENSNSSDENLPSLNDEEACYISEEMKKIFKVHQKSVEQEVSKYEREISSTEFTNTSVSSYECTSSSSNGKILKLKSMFKLPYIEWRQNEELIYMLISAKDCREYSLKITETVMDIIIKYAENDFQRAIIQLYGSVRPQFCSHELAGINIIVRLSKKFCIIKWPRLTMSSDKSTYIKFSSEEMPCIENMFVKSENSDSYIPEYSDEESSTNSSEEPNNNSSSDEEFF